ncbi:phosphopantetheine-binding protein [Haloarcula amylovorans]|uniref:phosphopantetheine-binding protein n=1 Tax=Haloarcula amylovorans TaxID=2562280 RepID=UPI001076B7CC|nr:phosphopantetheine-binding protein [Halomicroarcula amylolytica]
MSDVQEVDDRTEQIVADRLRVDEDTFDATTEFDSETLDAESLDMVEIAEAIEADIGVHIPDAALEDIDTVGDLKSYVADRA